MSTMVANFRGLGLGSLAAPDACCRAIVVVPARNEEAGLANTLDALRLQETTTGEKLPLEVYEVILLLNNCTDRSLAVAERYVLDHPEFRLRLIDCELEAERAHVGTARRMLMDCACDRLEMLAGGRARAILSTDADTLVAPDWVAWNLAEIEGGAEVVGGVIHLFAEELAGLDEGTRAAYQADRIFQARVAQLEAMLDPDPADPWPRHLEHFGASLACTPEVYRLSGGVPPVKPLEDVAFIDALRKVGARIRHSTEVHIYTSARLNGRAEVGLSGQLRHWKREADRGEPHIVDSAEWLEHRFRTLAELRRLNDAAEPELRGYPEGWNERLRNLHEASLPTPRFLELLDCNGLIEKMFRERVDRPARHGEIRRVIARLEELIGCASEESLTPMNADLPIRTDRSKANSGV